MLLSGILQQGSGPSGLIGRYGASNRMWRLRFMQRARAVLDWSHASDLVGPLPTLQRCATDELSPAQADRGQPGQARDVAVDCVVDVGLRTAKVRGHFSDGKDLIGVVHCGPSC